MSVQQQHNTQSSQVRADNARRLLSANELYGESNHPEHSYYHRVEARNACRIKLEQVLESEPQHPGAMGLLGRILMDDGDLEGAAQLFEASLAQDPDQPQQYTNLGYWALKSHLPALAEEYFEQALSLDRQSAAAFCGIAHARRDQGAYDMAYLHYRTLLSYGLNWPSLYQGMLTCAERLTIDQVDNQLVADGIRLLQRDGLPHQQINHFIATLVRQTYQLDQEDAVISLDGAAQDPLLLLAMERTLMPDPLVEDLITKLRKAILAEVAGTAELRDSLHTLVSAIGIYADRTGYALLMDDEEEHLVRTINESIKAQMALGDSREDIAGSLMISAMYGALFHQSFSSQLGQWSLQEWPVALQPLLAHSYYYRATEESTKQLFEEKQQELSVSRANIPQAWPSWQALSVQAETSLRQILTSQFGQDGNALPETFRIMVCGAESGQRSLELARYLSDVEVVAVDESLSNVALATRRAEDLGLDNIVFWPWSLAQRFVADGHRVDWIEVGRLPSEAMSNVSLAAVLQNASRRGTIVHLHTNPGEQSKGDRQIRHLIDQHDLPPTAESLRRLRRMVLNNSRDPLWAELLSENDFYALGGCHDRWFRPQARGQLTDIMGLLCNEVDWKLIRAQDGEGHPLANQPVQKQLQAEATGNPVQSLVGQSLTLYFQRRR